MFFPWWFSSMRVLKEPDLKFRTPRDPLSALPNSVLLNCCYGTCDRPNVDRIPDAVGVAGGLRADTLRILSSTIGVRKCSEHPVQSLKNSSSGKVGRTETTNTWFITRPMTNGKSCYLVVRFHHHSVEKKWFEWWWLRCTWSWWRRTSLVVFLPNSVTVVRGNEASILMHVTGTV